MHPRKGCRRSFHCCPLGLNETDPARGLFLGFSSFDLAFSDCTTTVSRGCTRCARHATSAARYRPGRATRDRTLNSAVHSHGPTPHATATLVPPLRDRTISRALYLSSLHCRDTVENEMHEKPPGPFSQSDGACMPPSGAYWGSLRGAQGELSLEPTHAIVHELILSLSLRSQSPINPPGSPQSLRGRLHRLQRRLQRRPRRSRGYPVGLGH